MTETETATETGTGTGTGTETETETETDHLLLAIGPQGMRGGAEVMGEQKGAWLQKTEAAGGVSVHWMMPGR